VIVNKSLENNQRLIKCAFNGDVECVKALLSLGCDPNFIPEESWTALHAAIENLELPVVELLLAAGADPNLKGPCKWTPLFHAVETA